MEDNEFYEYTTTDGLPSWSATSNETPEAALPGSDFRNEYDPRPIITYIFDVLFEGFNEYADDAPEFI